MTASIFRSFTALRPDDPDLSDEERGRIQVYRLLCLLAALLIPAFGGFYEVVNPTAVDPLWARLGFTGLFGGLVGASYLSSFLRRCFVPIVQGGLYVVLTWFVVITGLNDLAGNYAMGLPAVFTVVSFTFSIGITTLPPLLWFLGYGTLLVGGLAIVVPHPQTSLLILFACVVLLDILLWVVVHTQLSMQRTLKRTTEEARAANQLKSALLSNMSHEVRTPLTSILGFAELIAEADADDPQKLAARIHDSGERLLEMLNDVLQVSRLESGAVDLAPERLDAGAVVAERVEAVRSRAQQAGVHLSVETPEAPLPVYLDPNALRRIVDVLVRNAVEFSEEGDRARIVVRGEGGRLGLTVEDTGVGMSEAFQREVFEAFEQESVGQTRTHEGSGLGLTVAHRLVDLLGGTIEVESEEGAGTRIDVYLPCREPAPVS
jgi:signal transduction histidine kinase